MTCKKNPTKTDTLHKLCKPKNQKQKLRIYLGNKLRHKLQKLAFYEIYKCEACESKNKLEIHHVKYGKTEKEYFDKANWIILCKKCYSRLHVFNPPPLLKNQRWKK